MHSKGGFYKLDIHNTFWFIFTFWNNNVNIRDGSRYQIRWIFGKIPNSLRPPPSFLENYIATPSCVPPTHKKTKILQIHLITFFYKCIQAFSLLIFLYWQQWHQFKDIRDICSLLFSFLKRYVHFLWWRLALAVSDCHLVHCNMCILSSTMALWSKAEIQKYTFWWESWGYFSYVVLGRKL